VPTAGLCGARYVSGVAMAPQEGTYRVLEGAGGTPKS
jgi:hypothetical protein